MTTRPHDICDLYLAPVALKIDRELDDLAGDAAEDIVTWIAMCTDRKAHSRDERHDLARRALQHLVDTHGWDVRHDAREIRLTHQGHSPRPGNPGVTS